MLACSENKHTLEISDNRNTWHKLGHKVYAILFTSNLSSSLLVTKLFGEGPGLKIGKHKK